jgi:hypothetical protein
MYNFVKLHSISLEITRAVDEATITSALSGASIFINQYPTTQGIAPSYDLISANDSSYKIDTLTFSKQLLLCPIPDVTYMTLVGLAPVTYSSGKMMQCPLIQYMSGSIALGSDNTTVATEATKLYSVLVKYNCTFYYRA